MGMLEAGLCDVGVFEFDLFEHLGAPWVRHELPHAWRDGGLRSIFIRELKVTTAHTWST